MRFKLNVNTLKNSARIAMRLTPYNGIDIKLDGEPMLMNGSLTSKHMLSQIKEANKPSYEKYENNEQVMVVDSNNQDLQFGVSRKEMRE